MIVEYTPGRRQLRTVGTCLLRVPRHNLERYGRRSVSVTAPRLWNDLPDSLIHLTTYYFMYVFIAEEFRIFRSFI